MQSKNSITVDARTKMDPAIQRTTLWRNGNEKMNENLMAMNNVRQQDFANISRLNKFKIVTRTEYAIFIEEAINC